VSEAATAVADRLAAVRARIAAAAGRAGRDPGSVRLVGVSKLQPAAAVAAAYRAGLRDVGENYAQELVSKAAEVAAADLAWHFIGRLQRNKVKMVVGRAATPRRSRRRSRAAPRPPASGSGSWSR
jgi:uncharacterized pyridoxal phosphate-containing UPF0001 family protein